jgi:glycosyltransferase involved in cell wall biosynthesis
MSEYPSVAEVPRRKPVSRGNAPHSNWTELPECSSPSYDGACAKVGDKLYLFRGYNSLAAVNDTVFVFDLKTETWLSPVVPDFPIAHSHVAVCSDGSRYVYIAAGQFGPQCRPAIADCFVFDVLTEDWQQLPALPEPRYAGTMQLLGNQLHFVGGAAADRYTAKADHWTLIVENGVALGDKWQVAPPAPVAAMHRGSAVINGEMIVFGGQQGDFIAVPDDPEFTCNGNTQEHYSDDVLCYNPTTKQWRALSKLPIAASHTDFSVVTDGNQVHILGGQIFKHPGHFRLRLTHAIQSYDTATDKWRISGYLPYRVKFPVSCLFDGALYMTTGQRDLGRANDAPGDITARTWKMLTSNLRPSLSIETLSMPFQGLVGTTAVLVSHETSWTGAPLLLAELGAALVRSGVIVKVFSSTALNDIYTPFEHYGLPLLPIERAYETASEADIVVANTCVSNAWLKNFLREFPNRAKHAVLWNQEIDTGGFGQHLDVIAPESTMWFDSKAAQVNWQASTVQLPARQHVVRIGNHADFFAQTALTEHAAPDGLGQFNRDEQRQRMGLGANDFVLLCVGRIAPYKGQDELTQSLLLLMSQKPHLNIKLILVGFGTEEDCQANAKILPDVLKPVFLNGALFFANTTHISCFYQVADAFVINSQGPGETFGRVTIEAMAYALPVFGTNAGGTAEIVLHDRTGLLHPLGAAGIPVLANHIYQLYNDRERARTMGKLGKMRAEVCYNEAVFFRSLQATLTEVAGRH